MKLKIFLLSGFLLTFSLGYGQSRLMPKDSIINFSLYNYSQGYQQYLNEEQNKDFYNSTLLIVDGKKINVQNNENVLSVLKPNIKFLAVFTNHEEVNKYTTDRSIIEVLVVTTK